MNNSLCHGGLTIHEYAETLPIPAWTAVTHPVVPVDDRLSVAISTSEPQRFYRLRKPDL